jgi:hypothetical protein
MARNNYGEYGRCEATAKTTGEQCGQPAEGSHGKCRFHGAKSKRGEDHPDFKHGLFSDHLGPEERRTIDALGEYDDEQKLEELINWRLARLRRAVEAMDSGREATFWDAFGDLVEKTSAPEAEEIKELAQMLSEGNRAVQEEVDLVRRLIKDHNKIAEGEDVNLGWREMLGGGDS